MTVFYQFTELFATFIEGILVLSVASRLSDNRYNKKKNLVLTLVFTIIYTILITALNKWSTFSFVTLSVCIAYTFLITNIISKGSLLLRATSTMLSWFAVSATDYLLSYILIMIIGKSIDLSKGVTLILSPGNTRVFFLFFNKLISIIVFVIFSRLFPLLRNLSKKNLGILFVITSCAYILMSVITSLILSDSILVLQTSVIFSLFFIILSIITTTFATAWNSRYQTEKHERYLMKITNELMEKNFKTMQHSQNIIRQQVHDFKNHIRTINGMLEDETKAKKYTDELLEASYMNTRYCRSENEIINSIINCKMTDASAQGIRFKHSVLLTCPIHILSVDICAILANQIDNAVESCEKIPDNHDKEINVEIWQKETFLFFKVTNTSAENPFDKEGKLYSSKKNSAIHGFGIKNIRETVLKYNGELNNSFKDGRFISVAVVVNAE